MKNSEQDLNHLIKVFQDEISIYEQILKLEVKKTEIIQKSNGKSLENLTKQIASKNELAYQLEEKRNQLIEKISQKNQTVSLSVFLSSLDKNWQVEFKTLGEKLKNIVFDLKKKIAFNEKMILFKQELLRDIFDNHKRQNKLNVYSDNSHKQKANQTSSMLLNTTI